MIKKTFNRARQARQEQGKYRSGDAFGTRRPRTASEHTLETGGRSAGGGRYDPYSTQRPEGGAQPVLPGQTGYINQRQPVLRPSANMAPGQSAQQAASKYQQTGETPNIPTHRPYVQSYLDRLWGVREQQRARLNPQPQQQRPPDQSGTEYGWSGSGTRPGEGGGVAPGGGTRPGDGSGGTGPGGHRRPPVDPRGGPGGYGYGGARGGFHEDRQIRQKY